jgi:ElaB/YqjD/DUF883 family membrane-anchored ribosome-binding protein
LQRRLERGVASATAGAHGKLDSVASAVHPAVDQYIAGAHQVINSASAAAGHAARPIGRTGDQLTANGKVLIGRTGHYLRKRPVMTLGIAVAVGYLLSLILANRQD